MYLLILHYSLIITNIRNFKLDICTFIAPKVLFIRLCLFKYICLVKFPLTYRCVAYTILNSYHQYISTFYPYSIPCVGQ